MDDAKLDTIRDLTKFAPRFLTITAKKGGRPKLFEFNRAQVYLHQRLETQLKETGKVRAIILKGRQQGCSTYIQARYFHKVITSRGKKCFILTHEDKATKNLFEMAKRFYDNLPPGFVPNADTSNAKELYFKAFDSGYAVGTAGTKGVGRSQTLQLFHGSEAGYWPNAEEHSIGVLQAIGREEGTEIIIESTANGIGNYYHNLWKSASGGSSEYQAIFLPWYWQDEYSVQIEGFKPYDDEQQLLDLYAKNGMTEGHLAWRRLVIADFSHNYEWGVERFKSQYPNNAQEAFQNPIDKVFIDARYVMKARTNDVDSETGLIIGIDPAISNHDRTAIIRRRGRLAYQLEAFRDHNTMEICGVIKRIVEQEKPVKVYVDMIGIGAGIVDRCQEMGLSCVEGVNVARSANQKEKYINLRAELWDEMKKWLEGEMPVQIPDDDEFQGELCSVGFKHNSNNQLKIESKDELRSRGMPSPDCADALMLTFYSGQYAGESAYEVNRIPIQHARGFM